jgi:hypothetical protein
MKLIERRRLTRTLLFELPDDCFIFSNVCDLSGRPVFAAEISAHTLRQNLWASICAAGADQRLCGVTRDRGEYERISGADARNSERARQLSDIAATGDDDNAECAAADLAREFPDRT